MTHWKISLIWIAMAGLLTPHFVLAETSDTTVGEYTKVAADNGGSTALSPVGGGAYPLAPPSDHLSDEQRLAIQQQISASIEQLTAAKKLPEARGGTVSFGWPLKGSPAFTDPGYHGISNFVDQDATFPNALLDYNCGTRTYDLTSGYNHRGIDFFTWPFGWQLMDNDSVEIVAAAAGTIVFKSDGSFDRNCDFNNDNWNAVYVQHADGSIAWYGHMKAGSVTTKNIGDSVSEGEVLGVVGSSGSSTGPHLHFEVYDADENLIEPYAGACNSFNTDSWWSVQRDYYDSAVNALRTGFGAPIFPACPITEQPNQRTTFLRGELIVVSAYYRDQLESQISQYAVKRPDGSVLIDWTHSSNAAHYSASYWFWNIIVGGNDQLGTWTFEVTYEGETTVTSFEIIAKADSDGDAVPDHIDNCMQHANADQTDSNNDGYGNACDADINNDNIVNFLDLSLFSTVFLGSNADADFNSDGVVNFLDLVVISNSIFGPPGPSAYVP